MLQCFAADKAELQERRRKAAAAFHDGVLLIHAKSSIDISADGFRQDAAFYYFTGLENTISALLAVDGQTGQSWLFLPVKPPFAEVRSPEATPGADTAGRLAIEHVVDSSQLGEFLSSHTGSTVPLYYVEDWKSVPELPANIRASGAAGIPAWINMIAAKWPSFQPTPARDRVYELMAVQSASEMIAVRKAAQATVGALMAGLRAIHPGASQRAVESVIESACWQQGARGASFWPWAMAGKNGVFPNPFVSIARYDHLEDVMQSGDLVRVDVGCEWEHYGGDLGRTVPVSGHYSDAQRETWNMFVAAYHAGVQVIRDGATADQVFNAWSRELLRHRADVKSDMAKRAIESWSKRDNVPYWQLHTMNLDAGAIGDHFHSGSTIDFEPIASIDGQGFYLEDMFLVKKEGTEVLTPHVPYTAEEIEAAMK